MDDSEHFIAENEERAFSSSPIKPTREQHEPCCCSCVPKRYLLAFLTFTGFINVYALRVNLSVALVAMVSNITRDAHNGTTFVEPAEFDWDTRLQGIILSSFFYGYIITQIPGGWLASRYGGKTLFGAGILMTAVFTVLTPPAARCHPYLLITVRVLEGFFEGFTFPCVHAIWSKWAPPLERSKLVTISFSGPFAGTVLGMPLSGLIAHELGWPWVFYLFGMLGVIWSFFWFLLVTDTPQQHPKISREELEYITTSLKFAGTEKKVTKTPWSSIFTSLPVWAIVVAHFSENWGWYTLLTQLPNYLKNILKFSLEEAGVLSALPYLVMVFIVQLGGRLGDCLRKHGYLSTTAVRRLFNSIGFFSQATFLVVVGYASDKQFAIIGLTFAVGLGGLTWTGFPVNHLDIAPRHASLLFGVSNCIATLPGMFTPILVGYITPNETQAEWRVVFFISAGVYLFGLIFYALFTSGEKQAWNDVEDDDVTEASGEREKLLKDEEETQFALQQD